MTEVEERSVNRRRESLRRGIGRSWWTFVLRGLIAVAFGLVALAWPGITLLVLVVLFGAYTLVDGVVAVLSGFTGRETIRWWLVVWGLLAVGAGVLAFMWPAITALVLAYLIAAWAVVTGAAQIAAAITWRREIDNEWVLIVAGVLSIVVGGAIAIVPDAGALALVWLIGAYAVALGVLLVIVGFRLRDLSRPLEPGGPAVSTADTAEGLGAHQAGRDEDMDTDNARRKLEAERQRLEKMREAEIRNSALDEAQGDASGDLADYDQHPGDAGSETFERTKDLAVEDQIEERLAEVEDALTRLDEGEYGRCQICGRQIDEERLAVRPAARYCREHQQEVDAGH